MSRFLDEIRELHEALLRMVAFYRAAGRGRLETWARRTEGRAEVLFTGMGTSEFAPLAVRRRMASLGVACHTVDSGEWLHYGAALPGERGTVVLVSQSGESVEIRRIVEQNRAGPDFMAITNCEDSTLGRGASLVLPLCAGDEASISTKTYTNTLAILHLMACSLGGVGALEGALDDLERAASCLHSAPRQQISAAAEFLLPGDALAFVGRGPAYVAARQCALTFMEGARLLAAAFTAGAFRHGPFESCGPDLRAVVFLPEGRTRSVTEGIGRDAARLGARVVFVTDVDLIEDDNIRAVKVDNLEGEAGEDLFPLVVSGAHPLLLHHLAEARGVEAGHFRYGGKVTTKE